MKSLGLRPVGRTRVGGLGAFLCLFLLLIPAVFAQNGLVLHYSFDTDNGGTTTDLSGVGNHGVVNYAEFTAEGREGGAMFFNGTNAYIDAGNAASLQLQSNFTIAAWVKPDSTSINAALVAKSYGNPEQARRALEFMYGHH